MPDFKTVEMEARLEFRVHHNHPDEARSRQREEVVNVAASTELVRTDTPTVSQTVNADFIQTLPRSDRNALNFLIFLPGVTTVGGAARRAVQHDHRGPAEQQFNITIDGITNSNLLQSTDGFFSLVVPRLDAVEEVTLTTASAGADASGQGAIQMRFVTRSGTNKFETSLYWFMQHAMLNSNTYFNRLNGAAGAGGDQLHVWRPHRRSDHPAGLRRPRQGVLLLQPGRGLQPDRDRARPRTIIRQSALDGNFTYGAVGAQQTVNVLALAAASGIPGVNGTYDPTIKALLESIRTAAGTTGTIHGTRRPRRTRRGMTTWCRTRASATRRR